MSRMITLRVPEDRLERLDALVAGGMYATRAAALHAAIERLLAEAEEREIDRQIIEGYRRMPPTAEEEAVALAAARRSVAGEPW